MTDFQQYGSIATLHDLGGIDQARLERRLEQYCANSPVALVLPVTARDMAAEPFARIMAELGGANYLSRILVVLGAAPDISDYQQTFEKIKPLGDSARLIWTDSPRIKALYERLTEADLFLGSAGKGRAVWTAFGCLFAEPELKVFLLHDCDIINYDRSLVARLCLPMVVPTLDFEFCKGFYARATDRLYGRMVRLLVWPLLSALSNMLGSHPFVNYLQSFRYPLAGEFAVTSNLARINRIPCGWGLEIGALAEVYRNTSLKRVCQVDLCPRYEHKHQPLSEDDPNQGLARMAREIIITLHQTLSAMSIVLAKEHFATLHCAYLRFAQDAIRQYHADAALNGFEFDRHEEEAAVDVFASQIGVVAAQEPFHAAQDLPNWSRVFSTFPDFSQLLFQAVDEDQREFG